MVTFLIQKIIYLHGWSVFQALERLTDQLKNNLIQSLDLNASEEVQNDIMIYIKTKVENSDSDFCKINSYPSSQDIEDLTAASNGLFLCAKTLLGK